MQNPDESAESIFAEAVKLPVDERAAFVAQACGNNAALHRHLLRLIEAEAAAGTFLDSPPSPGAGIGLRHMPGEVPEAHQPGDRIGRYKLLEKIGEGGCGQVFMAEQIEPIRRKVALKVIKLGMDTKLVVARFEAERQVLALLDHPNIAKVLDAGATSSGRPFFVMELVKGISVTRYADENRLNTRQRLELFIRICEAVQHAHQRGIIHRDLKPSNVLVADHDCVAIPKVIDFGIAKATANQQLTDKTLFTAFAQFLGTPAYMSPEQAHLSGLDIDTRSDIYSLGVLLYELLTGSTPFDARRLLEAGYDGIRRIITEEEPPKPSTRLSTLANAEQSTVARDRGAEPPRLVLAIRGDLDWIVMKCLEKDRGRRYETASHLAADLQRHLSDEPVLASPPGHLYRLRKIARKNKPVVVAAAVVFASLVLATILSAQLARWALRERDNAERARDRNLNLAEAEAKAKLEARDQRDRAERHATTSRQRLVQLQTANGIRLLNQGEPSLALSWFLEALKMESDSTNRSRFHRRRLKAVLEESPRLTQVLKVNGRVEGLDPSADGKTLSVVFGNAHETENKRLHIVDLGTGEPKRASHSNASNDVVLAYQANTGLVLMVNSNGVCQVRSARTGEPSTTIREWKGPIDKATISAGTDRVMMVRSKSARFWSLRTGLPTVPILTLPGELAFAGFSPDGRRLVLSTYQERQWLTNFATLEECQVHVWDTETGSPVTKAIQFDGALVNHCVLHPQGDKFLSVTKDTVQQWDLETGRSIGAALESESRGSFNHVAYSPDGHNIVTAAGDVYHGRGGARLWEARSGKPLTPWMEHKLEVNQAAFSPGGDLLATASSDKTARVWDTDTGEPVTPALVHEAPVVSVAFAPDGHQLITGTTEGIVRIWDLAGQSLPQSLHHNERRVIHADFSRDGAKLLTACYDGKARIWDLGSGALLLPPFDHGDGSRVVVHASFNSDHSRVLSIAGDLLKELELWVWDTASGKPSWTIPGASQARFSPDGKRIAAAIGNTVHLLDHATRSHGLRLEHPGRIDAVEFSPDGRRLLTTGRDRRVRLWNLETGQETGSLETGNNVVRQALFTADGRHIAMACVDGAIRFCDGMTGRALPARGKISAPVTGISLSPDGRRMLATTQALVRNLDTISGQPLTSALVHENDIHGARFSPDNTLILTWSYHAGKAWLWDAETGQPMGPAFRHGGNLDFAAFHPNGMHLLTTGESCARIWPLADEDRPVEFLDRLYQLLSASSIDDTGSQLPLSPDAFVSIWREVHQSPNRPQGASWQERTAWYQHRAVAMESKRQWFSAAFYLRQWMQGDPSQSEQIGKRLVQAEAALNSTGQ